MSYLTFSRLLVQPSPLSSTPESNSKVTGIRRLHWSANRTGAAEAFSSSSEEGECDLHPDRGGHNVLATSKGESHFFRRKAQVMNNLKLVFIHVPLEHEIENWNLDYIEIGLYLKER